MDCRFSDLAEFDLEEIGDFIAQDNPARAVTFIQEIRAHCHKLTNAPQREIVDWLDDLPIRRAVHGSYNLYFAWLEEEETVYIVRIKHGARKDQP